MGLFVLYVLVVEILGVVCVGLDLVGVMRFGCIGYWGLVDDFLCWGLGLGLGDCVRIFGCWYSWFSDDFVV